MQHAVHQQPKSDELPPLTSSHPRVHASGTALTRTCDPYSRGCGPTVHRTMLVHRTPKASIPLLHLACPYPLSATDTSPESCSSGILISPSAPTGVIIPTGHTLPGALFRQADIDCSHGNRACTFIGTCDVYGITALASVWTD